MEPLVVVTHPDPISLTARQVDHDSTPDGSVALGYFFDGHLLARGVVAGEAVEAIQGLLAEPVSLALAATEDDEHNIDARVCLVLPFDGDDEDAEEAAPDPEPWKASVPVPPGEESYGGGGTEGGDGPRLALLPIGNVVRPARDRRHEELAPDVRDMLDNLMAGRARDAVAKAIDDLLDSL